MDLGILGLVVVAAVVIGAAIYARPGKVLPLDELLTRLSSIHADPNLTAAQKHHLTEIAYHGFESSTVSIIGGVHDVFPNNAIVIKTSTRELPLIGVELGRVSPEDLRAFNKGKAVTLRVRLPRWAEFSDIVGLPARFADARLFYGGRWYAVKGTYRVRDPAEPKTGEFKSITKTGEFTAVTSKTGTFKALPNYDPSKRKP